MMIPPFDELVTTHGAVVLRVCRAVVGPDDAEALRAVLVEEMGIKPRFAFAPLRVAVTGRRVSPPLFESMEILGKDSSLVRLRGLRNLAGGMVAMLLLSALFYALGGRNAVLGMDPDRLYDDLTLLTVTVFVYAIGYFGLRQPAITAPTEEAEATSSERVPYARSLVKDTWRASARFARLAVLP